VHARPDLAAQCDHEVGCITCGDSAVELRVEHVDAARTLARCVDAAGREELVETALVGAVVPGDVVLVHAGTAIQRAEAAA
jgi:hydrogenase maturation factor